MEVEALERGLNSRRCPNFSAVATRGEGVLETFAEIIRLTMEDLAKRHAAIALPPGQSLHDWTQQTIVSMFGAAQLSSGESDEEVVTVDLPEDALFGDETSARHLLKLAMPEEVSRGAPDARSSDVLAESYAQASTELGVRVNDLREERDLARARLAELKLALELAEQPAGEGEVEDRAQRILTILMRSAEAANASLLLTTTDPPQIMVLPPLVSDPGADGWGASICTRCATWRRRGSRTAASCPSSLARWRRPSPRSGRWRSCLCARRSACSPSRSCTTGRTWRCPAPTRSSTSASWAGSWRARSRRLRRARAGPASTACVPSRARRRRRSRRS
jgi:hypothetical protein